MRSSSKSSKRRLYEGNICSSCWTTSKVTSTTTVFLEKIMKSRVICVGFAKRRAAREVSSRQRENKESKIENKESHCQRWIIICNKTLFLLFFLKILRGNCRSCLVSSSRRIIDHMRDSNEAVGEQASFEATALDDQLIHPDFKRETEKRIKDGWDDSLFPGLHACLILSKDLDNEREMRENVSWETNYRSCKRSHTQTWYRLSHVILIAVTWSQNERQDRLFHPPSHFESLSNQEDNWSMSLSLSKTCNVFVCVGLF